MSARGVLFAITAKDRDTLIGQSDDDAVTEYVSDVIEERWEDDFVAETDKAWDAIHRCLTDGTLRFGSGTFPLNRCILGGQLLTSGEDYLVILTDVPEVPAVSSALDDVSQEWFAAAYERIDRDSYGPEHGPDDLAYTWDWFQGVRDLWPARCSQRTGGHLHRRPMTPRQRLEVTHLPRTWMACRSHAAKRPPQELDGFRASASPAKCWRTGSSASSASTGEGAPWPGGV